ncbi:MAG: glycosyltransferase family 4 protein [Lewinellaceae bacterium]|nr:glycosyltransferase family 4 protein [Lewinellaceae bacterium]
MRLPYNPEKRFSPGNATLPAMPIKVLVISNYRETASVRPEAELFIGLKKAGLDIEIMTYGDAWYVEKFRAAGIKVIDFHPQKKLDKAEIRRIRETLVHGGHHILHLFNSKAIINGIQAAKGLPVKVVLYRGYAGNIHWYDPTAYFKYLHPRVDKITCIAEAIEDYLKGQLFFKKEKAVTIHKGHDLSWYQNIKPLDLSGFNIPENAFVATCVANARPMKGIPYLIQSSYYLPPELPIYYILVGKNLNVGKAAILVKNSPHKDKIYFTEYRNDALHIVAASDVFVLSSIYGEATTKAVIEAMSLGKTPVITDIPGNRGLVVNEQCGLVVPPRNPKGIADAILKLYHHRDLCKKYGVEARKHIMEHFNIRNTVEKTRQLYEQMVSKKI